MIVSLLTLLAALILSATSAYYSIIGLTAIFSAAFLPIIIMGGALEFAKIMSTLWLHYYWEQAGLRIKMYLVPAVFVLMFLTSLGSFGFLSKSHVDQNLTSGDVQSQIAIYDEKIAILKGNIESERKALTQLDAAVDQVMARSTTEGGALTSNNIRRAQQKERKRIQTEIETAQKQITTLNEQRIPIAAQVRKVEAEVGPIKYIAALIYGDNPDANLLESAVRWVIIVIVSVFDPLAIVLLLAATSSLDWANDARDKKRAEKLIRRREEKELAQLEKDAAEKSKEEQQEPVAVTPIAVYNTYDLVCNPSLVKLTGAPVVISITSTESIDVDTMPLEPQCINTGDSESPDGFGQSMDGFDQSVFDSVPDETDRLNELLDTENSSNVVSMFPAIGAQGNPTPIVEEQAEERTEERTEEVTSHITLVPATGVSPTKPLIIPAKAYDAMLAAQADNDVAHKANSGFGIAFPINPIKGDMFVRVDYLPSRLFKWNDQDWIEVTKSSTDSYAYNEQYIQHLVEQLGSGIYDVSDLTDVEQEQVRQFLTKIGQ